MIGRTLGHYEIVGKLGEGGMGAVYRARDTTLGRDVALKLLPEFVAGDGEKIARLEREARLLASLSHPNIATLHGLEESNGLKYLVMELVPGETLAERISRGPLRIEECLGIFRQIAEGLEAAHEKGIVHRDLKPANVIVTSEGRVKVLDFGLAKAVAEEASSSDLSKSPTLTREGTEQGVILGTASYMSPEQARGKTLDRRTDIWSFGCVFYEALTGRKAFSGETVSDILAAILEREPDWTALPVRTPVKIRELLRWCLQKDPHQRLRDIGDSRIESDEPAVSSVTPTRRRYLPWAVAALFLGIAVWSLLRPAVEPERAVSRLTVNLPSGQTLSHPNDPAVALSPDGKRLIYVGGTETKRQLYVRRMDQLDARPIPGTENAASAFFSPDGTWLGFYAEGIVKKLRLDGGTPVALCDAPNIWGASWGPGETILFTPSGASGLSRVSASGGAQSVVTTPDATHGETSHRWPEILPGGKAALFTILAGTSGPRIALLSLETGDYRVLFEGGSFARYVHTGHVVYANEGTLWTAPFDLERLEVTGEPVSILEGVWTNLLQGTAHFSLSRDGTLAYVPPVAEERTLVWVDRTGAVQPITETRRVFEDPRLSPDGRRLAVTIRDDGYHIWVYEISRDILTKLSLGVGKEEAPVWAPDGSRLAFMRGPPANLFWQRADGSGEAERLSKSDEPQTPTAWSPDGKVLVYHQLGRRGDIWFLTLDGERKAHPFLQTPFGESGGVLSPDGRFLAYHSNESGMFEVFVRPFPGVGGKWQISSEGGVQPVWARSGHEIFYRNGDKMMAVPVGTEPAFQAGRPIQLFEKKFAMPDTGLAEYDVTPDGERFVMLQDTESSPTEIQIVLNWFEELKARVPSPKR
jgi:serine/threonine-protein kinase